MSLKAKLISTISAFCLVLALLVVGVFAAQSATIQLGGTVSFTATAVVGDVTITYSGEENSQLRLYAEFDADTPEGPVTWTEGDPDAQNLEFTQGEPITVTITIHNAAIDRSMWVLFDNLPSTTMSTGTVSVSTPTYDTSGTGSTVAADTPFQVLAGQTIQVQFSLLITSGYNNDLSGTWTCAFDLSNDNPNA